MRTNLVYTLHLWPPLGHARHYTGSVGEDRLSRRLADHALGRGARLTQVQVERGGFWVLAQTQPGNRTIEHRLKQHGAARRCAVCKAVDGYQSGHLTAAEALARVGWDRSTEVQQSVLLDIFGLSRAPENIPAQPAARARPTTQPGPGGEVRDIPEARPVAGARHITPGVVALVNQLEATWATQRQTTAAVAEPEAGS